MLFLILSALLILYFFFYHLHEKRKGLPPGPLPFPILGNVLELGRHPTYTLVHDLTRKYGPMYTLWFGKTPNVFINDYELIKEVLTGKLANVAAGRPENYFAEAVRDGRYGLAFTDGPIWRNNRRFALHTLRNFGFGTSLMEQRILIEVQELLAHVQDLLEDRPAASIDMEHPLQLCSGNIINSLLVGYGFGRNNHWFEKITRTFDEAMQLYTGPAMQLLLNYKWLRFVPLFDRFSYNTLMKLREQLWAFFEAQIREHKAKEQNVRDTFIGAYLEEMRKTEHKEHFNEHELVCVAMDLWLGGVETTSTTLRWALLFMIHFPEIQECVRKEIQNLETDDLIHLSARQELPYTNAVLNEVQRLGNILTINVQHSLLADAEIGGFQLKQGTAIIPQVSAVHRDPRFFPNPEKFDPERFLGSDGSLKKIEQFLPFSLGKRLCLGESLARMELLLIFTNLIGQFRFSVVPGCQAPALEPQDSFVIRPRQYHVWVEKII